MAISRSSDVGLRGMQAAWNSTWQMRLKSSLCIVMNMSEPTSFQSTAAELPAYSESPVVASVPE